MKRKLLALLLALSLLTGLALPALAAETATLVRLTKTTGTVEISKSSGKSVSLLQNMRLYNGYHVETSEESYAWINLDDSKLLKEDAESEIELRKDGKKLEVQLSSGNVFFDVAEPLEDDESMNIRTSTTVVGIRGTSGWIQVEDRWNVRISVLEGVVECSVTDPVTGQIKAEEVHGGETALCVVYPQEQTGDKCDIIREKFTVDDIPGFVLTELTRDMALCDKIEEATGLDIPRDLASVAGGDPSGREPDREHATPEVLGESDRREDEDEDALHEKLEEIEKELEKQPDEISPDKVVPKPSAPAPSDKDPDRDSGGGSGSSGGTTTPDPTPPTPPTPPQTHGMKLKDVEVQALLADTDSLSIEPNTDAADTTPKKNTLEVDTGLSVASGKTLDLQSGIDLEVYPGKTLQVDGTLTADALANNGTTVVTSGNTLRLRGNLTTAGTLTVTSTGRVVVDGTFTNSGTVALTSGATVLAKTFAPNAAPSGWEVSATADTDGYYKLIPAEAPPTPPTPSGPPYTITFDAGGGTPSASTMQTDENGVLASLPTADYTVTQTGKMELLGWYTAKTGGTQVTEGTAFDRNTTVYAQWNGWILDGGKLTLTEYAVENNYPTDPTAEKPEWYDHRNSITNVVIPDGITRIGNSAFLRCSSLTGVTIPESVTAIGEYAFYECSSLTSVTIPDGVTSIGNYAFSHCSGLTSVTIPDSVTSIGRNAFYECSSLTSVTIPKDVTRIWDRTFEKCSNLTSVTFAPGSKLATIEERAFGSCTGLTSISIPDTVTKIGVGAFSGCTGLTSVTIPEGVTSIRSSAFASCTGLTSVTFAPGSKLATIGDGAFYNCTGLTSVTIPDTVTIIGSDAFSGCSGLSSVTIPDGVTRIGSNAFAQCTGLTSITIPSSVTSIGFFAFQWCSSLTTINFGGTADEWTMLTNGVSTGIPDTATVYDKDGQPIV